MTTNTIPTPGQVCYEAYMAILYAHRGQPFDPTSPGWHYRSLEQRDHHAWEAAAEAVQDRVMQDLIAGGAKARQERQDRRAADAC